MNYLFAMLLFNHTELRSYSEYGVFEFQTTGNSVYTLGDSFLTKGKFFEPYNQDNEISPEEVNAKYFSRTKKTLVGVSGRRFAVKGVEGGITVKHNGYPVLKLKFEVPWVGPNWVDYYQDPERSGHVCTQPGYPVKGSLGTVKVRCYRILT